MNAQCSATRIVFLLQLDGEVVNVTATSVELTGLRPGSTYTISVRAYTAAGPGEERRLTVAAATTNICSYLDSAFEAYEVVADTVYCSISSITGFV